MLLDQVPEAAVEAAARADYERVREGEQQRWPQSQMEVGGRKLPPLGPWEDKPDDAKQRSMERVRPMLEAALPFLVFGPLGDNHHNAAMCPYCTTPARRLDLAAAERIATAVNRWVASWTGHSEQTARAEVTAEFVLNAGSE